MGGKAVAMTGMAVVMAGKAVAGPWRQREWQLVVVVVVVDSSGYLLYSGGMVMS